MTLQLPLEVVELLALASAHAEGVEPLFEGDLESVASLYQVHPSRLERAREVLADPRLRSLARQTLGVPRREAPSPQPRAPYRDVASLIGEAMSQPHGLEVLTEAPMEMAAILLGAHPFLVEEARLRLASRTAAFTLPSLSPRPGACAS